MRKNIRPSFLDPRTKILIWLLANVVVFTWSPAVFQLSVMVAYLILFLVERKGTMLAGLLATYLAILAIQYWLLPLLPGSLATVFATVTYFILVFPCIAGGAYLIATTSVSQFIAALEGMGAPRSFSITLAVTLRFLPSLRQDLRHIRDAMALRRNWSAFMYQCLWGQPRQQKNSASPPPLGASSPQGRCPPGGLSDFTFRMWWSHCCFWRSVWAGSAARGCYHDYL